MAIRPYVGEEALRELVRLIKTRTASVYTVKGNIGICTYDEGTQQYVHTPANLPYYIWGVDQGPTEWFEFAHIVDGSNNEVTLQEGWVFNLAVDYTVLNIPGVPSPFIDKERGEIIKAGTNICIVNVGTAEQPVYKYDCLATSVDLTPYQTKKLTDADIVSETLNSIYTAYVYNSYSSEPRDLPNGTFYGQVGQIYNAGYNGAHSAQYKYWTGSEWRSLYSSVVISGGDETITISDYCTVEQMLACIAAYAKNVKQGKTLSSALTMLTPDFTYATVAAMPATGATAEGIETGDIAYVTETAKLYQATVDGSDNITWAEIGDQTTVEGAIKLLGSLAPNRSVTAAEVQTLFNA